MLDTFLFLFIALCRPSIFLFRFFIVSFGLSISLFGSFVSVLSLDLRGLVLDFSIDSYRPRTRFHFFYLVAGLRGAEPSRLFWGQSFLYWFHIPEMQNIAYIVALTSP